MAACARPGLCPQWQPFPGPLGQAGPAGVPVNPHHPQGSRPLSPPQSGLHLPSRHPCTAQQAVAPFIWPPWPLGPMALCPLLPGAGRAQHGCPGGPKNVWPEPGSAQHPDAPTGPSTCPVLPLGAAVPQPWLQLGRATQARPALLPGTLWDRPSLPRCGGRQLPTQAGWELALLLSSRSPSSQPGPEAQKPLADAPRCPLPIHPRF